MLAVKKLNRWIRQWEKRNN